MRPYIAQIRSNLRLMGRDRSVLFFSYLFPLVFFFPFAQLFGGKESPAVMAQVISMVLIIGILGNGFFGAGMRAVQDRETNVLRRFKVAPINAGPIIVASLASGLVAFLPTVLLFIFFARLIYHMPVPHNLLSLLAFVCIGVVSFRALGMIIAATVNSAQEAGILTQVLYLPMLFMSGATFPMSFMPRWIQKIAQFLPATYLFQGMQSIMIQGESIAQNLPAVIALLITLCVAVFVGIKLFRWEKEERIKNSAKLWILAVLAPFVVMGVYQARTEQNIVKAKILAHNEERNRSLLFQNARIFVGTGKIISNGAVLIRNGKIAQVFDNPPANPRTYDAELIDVSGKTLMPGLIDMHVHIGASGGVYQNPTAYMNPNAPKRRLAAYLYSGITAVRSTGDFLDESLKLRAMINSGEYLGAEVFACGPLFTAPGGHPTEFIKYFPENIRKNAAQQFVRLPKSPDEARKQVDDLKKAGVDCIKSVLESGNSEWGVFNRLDTNIYRAVVDQAHKDGLPTATHTGSSADVKDAIAAGTNTIEHGSMVDVIPAALLDQMKQNGIAYDPTMSVFEALADSRTGNLELLNRSLVQQVGPADLLADTRAVFSKEKPAKKPEDYKPMLARDNLNLLAAYKAGVLLITGSDAGNMLVIHGPTVQHEMQLWIEAGIPTTEALQAATYNAARALRVHDRIGSIQAGRDATFILLDGDPVADISNSERISMVVFRGQRIDRSDLFEQSQP